jgi:hypothetical protein
VQWSFATGTRASATVVNVSCGGSPEAEEGLCLPWFLDALLKLSAWVFLLACSHVLVFRFLNSGSEFVWFLLLSWWL